MVCIVRNSILVTPEVMPVPLDACLGAAVVRIAQSLPVADVPEQQRIALVRDDVVDLGRLPDDAVVLAHLAQRVLVEKHSPRFAPAPAVEFVAAH